MVQLFKIKFCDIRERENFIIKKGFHDDNALLLVLDGKFSVTRNNKTDLVQQNEAYIFKSGEMFERKVLSPLKLLYILFDCNDDVFKTGKVYFKNDSRLTDTINYIMLSTENPLLSQALDSLSHDILTQIFIENILESKIKFSVETNSFIKYVNENIHQKISIEKFAQDIPMSHVGFTLKFKKETSFTPAKYISNKRLEMAKIDILQSNLTISEISQKYGFENLYYFSNFFKKNTGVSPKEYRSQAQNL